MNIKRFVAFVAYDISYECLSLMQAIRHISPTQRPIISWPSVLDFPGQSFISGSVLDCTLSWICPGFEVFWVTLHWKMRIVHSTMYSTLDFWVLTAMT